MKIYIVNILPSSLKNKIDTLIEVFGVYSEKIKYELCSKEFGINIIEQQDIIHIETTFKTDYELIKDYELTNGLKYDLLVDKTIYTSFPILSQIPVNYISSKYYELEFKIHKKGNLSLIIDCFEEINNFERNIIPINFYFNYNEKNLDLNDHFFQNDFNMLLSLLK